MDLGADYTALTLLPAAYARKDRVEIKNILSYFFYISLFISLTIGVLILLISPLLTDWLYHQEGIGRLARYVILAVMVRTLFFILTLTLQSIRKIMKIVGMKNNARINVKLDVPKWSKKHHVEPSLKDQNEDTTKL